MAGRLPDIREQAKSVTSRVPAVDRAADQKNLKKSKTCLPSQPWRPRTLTVTMVCHISLDSSCKYENDCIVLNMDICRNKLETKSGAVCMIRLSRDSLMPRGPFMPRVMVIQLDTR